MKHMTLDDFKAELDLRKKWQREHPFQAAVVNAYDFVRWTTPRVMHEWIFDVKYALQRMVRGYDNSFVWNHHWRHSALMVRVLTDLKKTHVGSPTILFKEGADDNAGHAEWDKILQKMIDGFQASLDMDDIHVLDEHGNYDPKATHAKYIALKKVQDTGLKLYVRYYNCLWD